MGDSAVSVERRYGTLARFLEAWHRQKDRHALILEAQDAARRTAATLTAQHNSLERTMATQKATAQSSAPTQSTADRIAGLKRLSLQRQLMSTDDDRIGTENRLADVYGKWAAQVVLQHRIMTHLIAIRCI